MSDASDRVSCISHKKATRFFVIYDDFLTVAKVSEHQHKLAAFWRVLETKTNDWIAQHADKVDALLKADKPLPKIWVEMNYNDFVNRCLGFYKASSFRIAAVESERLGFSESRVRTRKTKPTDPDSPTEEYKEYCLNIQALQSVMNGGAYPTPVENNSPLLKKRKKKTPVENNSPSVENNKPPLLKTTETPVENNNLNNIEEYSKDVEEENALSSIDETRTLSNSSSSITDEAIPSQAPSSEQREATQPLSEENGTTEPALPEIEPQREKEASAQANGVSDSQKNTGKASSGKPGNGSRKPRKPTVSDDQRKRIDHVYDVLDALGCEVTESESYHYQRTKSDDDLILNWFKCSPTEEMLGDVYRKLWNTPKDTKTGFDWKENMSIRAVLKQYDRLALGIKANKQKEAKKTQVSDTKQVVETIATLAASAGYKNQIWDDDDDLEYLPPVSKKQGA